MRALQYSRYGPPDVLEVVEIDEPVPFAGEVKVRVHAAGLNPVDGKIRAGHLRFLPIADRPPRGCGLDFAGEVVGSGGAVANVFPGMRVFGSLSPFRRAGAFAEFVCVLPARIAPMPATLGYAEAAALPIAAGTAAQALVDHARVAPGQRVLVNGAAGGVGHFAVQLAHHLGAHVTGTCGPDNVAFVRSLGADVVIDYTASDFTTGTEPFDAIFDATGQSSWRRCRAVLAPRGVYVNTSPDARAVVTTLADRVAAGLVRQRVVGLVLHGGAEAWRRLARLVDERAMAPHIRATVGLADVAEAQRRMDTGHGRGKVVVDPSR